MLLRKFRENWQSIAMLFAVCLAITAQYLFTGEIFFHLRASDTWAWTTRYTLALVMLLCAIGLATWAAFPHEKVAVESASAVRFLSDDPKARRFWFISSILCYLLSIILYLLIGENSIVRWLWLAAIGLLIIPLWFKSRGRSTAEDKISSWEWIAVGIISIAGFALRYWKLTEIPSQVDNDVALMGNFGLELIKSGRFDLIGFSASEHLQSYDQFMAWSMRLFGQNHYGIVMHSVVFGTLALVFIYLLGREVGGRFVGFVAMGLLATSYTHIHFSRTLFGSSISCIAIFVFYSLSKGLRTRDYFWFALAGLFGGWGLLLYDSSRVLPIILLAILIWQWLWQSPSFRYKNWVVLVTSALIGFGPMLAFAIRDFSNFSGRANVVTLWNPTVWSHQLGSYQTTSAIEVLWQQTWRTFLTTHLTGDGSPHFAFPSPIVSPLTAMLLILGLGYVITRMKNIRYFAILVWIFLTFIFGGVLTADPPYWPHLNIALPAIFLVAAMGAKHLEEKVRAFFGRVGQKVFLWVLISIILISGFGNLQVYYDYVKNNAGTRTRIARYLASLPTGYTVYIISPIFTWDAHAFRFFNQDMTGQDLAPETLTISPPALQQPTVFILFEHPELAPVLQKHYPGGDMENHFNAENLVSFVSYRVIPPDYQIPPKNSANPLYSTGWLLIAGFIIYSVGRLAYLHYSSIENNEMGFPVPAGGELPGKDIESG